MDFFHRSKEIFENPYIVAKIQKFFGVTYKSNILKVTSKEAQNQEETTAFQRKKSVQNPCTYYKIEENDSQPNEPSPWTEDTQSSDASKESTDAKNAKNYVVENKFWYFFFLFGTYLGDEVGYAVSIPFLLWNIDAVVARKLVLVWTIVMYIGQSIKDVLKWPRPMCPPVIRLQQKWSLEHGMPSTHAMVGIAFPSSVLYYSLKRYEFQVIYGIVISVFWCVAISVSRLYLGMHSLLDVLAGLFLSSVLVIPLLPAIEYVDNEWLKADVYYYPLAFIVISFLLLDFYPSEHKWTPTKSDTSTILGTCVGVQIGFWLDFHLKNVQFSNVRPPYSIELPDRATLYFAAARTVVGLCCIAASFIMFKILFKVVDVIFEKLLKISPRIASNKQHIPILDLSYKYLSYCVTAFHVTCSIPKLFNHLNIANPSYYLE